MPGFPPAVLPDLLVEVVEKRKTNLVGGKSLNSGGRGGGGYDLPIAQFNPFRTAAPFGGQPLKFYVVRLQNETAVLDGSRGTPI